MARNAWPATELPVTSAVSFRLAYFYVFAQAADLDNIVKPAQDALERIAYMSDRQIIDVVASARPKLGQYRINVTPLLARALVGHSDFVHIRVDPSTDFEVYK
jgi:Holliday junction resolvase RusA-like endonuclease